MPLPDSRLRGNDGGGRVVAGENIDGSVRALTAEKPGERSFPPPKAEGARLWLALALGAPLPRRLGPVLLFIAELEAAEQHAPFHAGIAFAVLDPVTASPVLMRTAPTHLPLHW